MIIQLSLLVLLMIIGLGPGMMITRRMRLAPLERLCTAIGISGIVIYLIATAIYLSGINWQWTYLASLLFLITLLLNLAEFRRLLSNHAVRRTLGGFALLLIWMFLLLALLRTYSGGIWTGDWYEHYERTEFFLNREPLGHLFINTYLLPARPPMMNLLAAFFLAQVGRGFPAFELCFAILNLSAFLPAALLLNRLCRRGSRGLWFLVAALACSPFFAQNVTYTWTKLLCAFYVLLAIALYLDRRSVLAFVMLAAACLVHYSAAPFALFISLHYFWQWLRGRRGGIIELGSIFILGAGLLATWFTWSIWFYGFHTTLASNTAVSDSSALSTTGNLAKILWNIFYAFVPAPLGRIYLIRSDQAGLSFVRDVAFLCYQQNFLFMMGSVGAVITVWALWRTVQGKSKEKWFWIGLVGFCVPVAIATHGAIEPYGNAHVVLQPLVLIAIATVAANAPFLPAWAMRWLAVGWALDFSLGVWLQIYLENMTFEQSAGRGTTMWSFPLKGVVSAAHNFLGKQTYHLMYIGDYFANCSIAVLTILPIVSFAGLLYVQQNRSRLIHQSVSGNRRAVAKKLS